MTDRNYNLNLIKGDPLGFLAGLIGLESQLPQMKKNEADFLPILTGLTLYRQLSTQAKRDVLKAARYVSNDELFGMIQGRISGAIFNPNWNPWSLSNHELQSMMTFNKGVSNFLGTWFFTVEIKPNVSWIAAAILALSAEGFKGAISTLAGQGALDAGLKRLSIRTAGTKFATRSFLIVALIASVLKNFSDADARAAKAELLSRGLLRPEDL